MRGYYGRFVFLQTYSSEKQNKKIDKAVDTTAAGDTFTGYFLAGLSEGLPMEQVLRMSAKASSIAVTREGAVPSIPYREEVMAALATE